MKGFLVTMAGLAFFIVYVGVRETWPDGRAQDFAIAAILIFAIANNVQLGHIQRRVRQMTRHLNEYEE